MATKRIECSKQRLIEKINEGKKYLEKEKEHYDVNELIRLKNHLEKKKAQFEKDITEYENTTEMQEQNRSEYEDLKVEGEDIYDDLEHYINVIKQEQCQREREREQERQAEEKKLEREAEEKKLEREAEEKKLERQAEEKKLERQAEEKNLEREAEERDKDRHHQLEMERLGLEERRMKILMEEKISFEKLNYERIKVEAEEKIAVTKAKEKLIVKLPKLELKKFDGNILKWTEFWDRFESTIHNNKSLHNVDIFNYLKSQLQGTAAEVLSGLELTKDNYNVAIELLKERYGRKHIMADAHYAKMMNMPMATYRATSLRTFYDTTEKHLRCLRSLGEDDNQMQVLSMLKSKLPRSVLLDLERMKAEDEEWTVKNFRKLLQRHINAQEACDLQTKLFQKYDESPRNTYTHTNRSFQNNTSPRNFTGETLLSNENIKPRYHESVFSAVVIIGVTNVVGILTSNLEERS